MKRLLSILVLMFVLCVADAAAQYNKRYIAWATRNMIASDNYDEAIELLGALIRSDKNSHEAFYLRGYAKLGLGDLLGAKEDLTRALELNPVYTEAFHYRGIVNAELGNYEDAVRDFTEAINLRPDIAGSYYSRGVTHMRNKQWVRSLVDFDMVLRFTDKDAQTYINRGIVLCGMRDTLGAHKMFDTAIRTNREYPEAYNRKAILLLEQERWEEALEMFDMAIKYDSTYLAPLFNRAITLSQLERYDQAVEAYERVLELDPYVTSAYYNLAIIYSRQENYPKALENYNLVLEHTPENVKGYFNRASVHMAMEQYQAALNDYTKAIELYPDFANAYLQRGRLKEMLRDYQGARSDKATAEKKIAEYKARLEEDPEGLAIYADTSRHLSQLLSFESQLSRGNRPTKESGEQAILREMFRWRMGGKDVVGGHHYYSPELEENYRAEGVELVFSNEATLPNEETLQEANGVLQRSVEEEAKGEALAGWGIVQLTLSQYTSAVNLLSEAIALEPDNAMLYINRAVARAEMIDYIASFADDDRIDIDSERAFTGRRRVYSYNEAIEDLTRAAELAPELAYIYYNRACLYAYEGDMPAAFDDFTKALELAPYLADAYFNRGLVQIYMKDVQKGIIDLGKAGELGIKEAYALIKRYQNTNN